VSPEAERRVAAGASAGHDDKLARQMLQGGRAGEQAGLESLLRRRPQCWEEAVAVLAAPGVSTRRRRALAAARRAYRGLERRSAGAGRQMSARRRVLRAVYERADFNALRLRLRLPRPVRRSIEPAPPGHVGLVVQIVSSDDCALVTVREHVPENTDVTVELARLEAKARERLT
jgi:hypothetical protein